MMVTMTLTEVVNVLVALEPMSAHDARCRAYDYPDSELSGRKPAAVGLCNCQIARRAQAQADALGQAGLIVGIEAPPEVPKVVSPGNYTIDRSVAARYPQPRLHWWPRWGKSSRIPDKP